MDGDVPGVCDVNNDDSEIIVEFNPLATCNVGDEYDIIDDDAVLTTACSPCGTLDDSEKRRKGHYESGPRELLKRPPALNVNKSTVALPRINCAEKIIICLDISNEVDSDERSLTRNKLITKVVEFFLSAKHKINSSHEFALVILQEKTLWLTSFTNQPGEIIPTVIDVLEGITRYETADLTSLFHTLQEKVLTPPYDTQKPMKMPPFITRAILIYSRHCVPFLDYNDSGVKEFLNNPYFFWDVLYLHEVFSIEDSQETFDVFTSPSSPATSYIYGLPITNSKDVLKATATLLAHPLQRPPQHQINLEMMEN